jgi:hypothetical protein
MNEQAYIQDVLFNLQGKLAWGQSRDIGSIFFLHIGDPHTIPELRGPFGEWHFLIECCHWRFETSEGVVVGSEDDQRFIDATFAKLDLGKVESAVLLTASHDLKIEFSSGTKFKTFTTSAEAADQWTQWRLYGPEDLVWRADGGGKIECRDKNQPAR